MWWRRKIAFQKFGLILNVGSNFFYFVLAFGSQVMSAYLCGEALLFLSLFSLCYVALR
jgi:hypothetical protein